MSGRAKRSGLLAEFDSVDAMHDALHKLREQGYSQLEPYTPFDDDEVDEILGHRPSRLPFAILAGGLFGAGGAYLLEWLTNAYWFPIRVGGRPPHFPLAYVPITFEMGVLFASLTAFFGVLFASNMFRLWTPESEADGFERSTNDSFWIAVDRDDARFEREKTLGTLRELGAERVSPFGDCRTEVES